MPLEIQALQNIGSQNSGAITVKLIGSLDTATAPNLEREIGPLLARCGKDLVFDLAQLKFISSAGLRVLMLASKQARAQKGYLVLVSVQPLVQEILEISKFTLILRTLPAVRDALAETSPAGLAAFEPR